MPVPRLTCFLVATVSPNEVMFVNSSCRVGVLPRMLSEILQTRIMVKKAMKAAKDDKVCTVTLVIHVCRFILSVINSSVRMHSFYLSCFHALLLCFNLTVFFFLPCLCGL